MKSILVIALVLIILAAPSCEKDDGPKVETFWESEKLDETPPVFSSLPLDLNAVIIMISFGGDLPETKNPTFEYYTNSSAVKIKAVCGGTVTKVTYNDRFEDYSISIKQKANSAWTIIYDHIKNLIPKAGDVLIAGAELGTIGTGDRVELQINKAVHGNADISVCPLLFGNQAFNDEHNTLRLRLAQQYPTYYTNLCFQTIVTP